MSDLKETLKRVLGENSISDEDFERLLYSHDLVSLPKMLKKLYKTVPDVIVRPKDRDQVVSIVRLANEKKLPIIPKGSSTSPTGGAVPIFGGLALDISAMNAILNLDDMDSAVEVEPGVIWETLEKYLEGRGFTLNVYPTSAPASTVGGWAATSGLGYGQGGVGVGSCKYGAIGDNVLSLEVVLPSGEVKKIPSEEYSVRDFIGTDGILGIITRIRLKVRKKPEAFGSYSFSFETVEDLCNSLNSASKSVRLYFCEFQDRNLVEMKKEAEIPSHGTANLVTFTLEGERGKVRAHLTKLMDISLMDNNGEYLGCVVGGDAWNERFNPVKIKKAGPSMLSSEFIVDISVLREAFDGIYRIAEKYKKKIGVQGILVKGGASLIPLILKDERRGLDYMLSLSMTMEFNDLAIKLKGKPYGVGLFNSFYSKQIHGGGLERLKRLKKEVDPANIMNPGKSINHMTRFGIPLPRMLYSTTMHSFGLLKRLGIGGNI